MTIYSLLQYQAQKLKSLEEIEGKKQRLHHLDPLKRELGRTIDSLDELLAKRRLWVDVYRQPPCHTKKEIEMVAQSPLKRIPRSSEVFNVEENEILDFQEDVRSTGETFDQWQRELTQKIQAFCNERSATVEMRRTLLRIPDFFADRTERQRIEDSFDNILALLELEDVSEEDKEELFEAWATAWSEFEKLQSELSLDTLRQRFSLSEDAVSVLEQFARGDTLWLSSVPVNVLEELQQIQRFAAQVSLKFEAE